MGNCVCKDASERQEPVEHSSDPKDESKKPDTKPPRSTTPTTKKDKDAAGTSNSKSDGGASGRRGSTKVNASEPHDDAPVTEVMAGRKPQDSVGPTPRHKVPEYQLTGPTVEGEAFECFKGGLLYRIVVRDRGTEQWFFYNDTMEYEMQPEYTFGPGSKLTFPPGVDARPVAEEENKGWTRVKISVLPGRTEMMCTGHPNGFRSNFIASPLRQEQVQSMIDDAYARIARELAVVKQVARSAGLDINSASDEQILAACVAAKVPYVDPRFTPSAESLSRVFDEDKIEDMVWARPTHFLPARMHDEIRLVRGVEPDDIDQGQLGDCWFLCAVAAIAEDPDNVRSLFRHKRPQVAKLERAVGAYRVTLNKHGWWTSVVVDDYLPMQGRAPAFAKNLHDRTELWASIVEKAYAKLHGSYAAITAGDALQALTDLTGFPTTRFDKEWTAAVEGTESTSLFDTMLRADRAGFMLVLNTPGEDNSDYMSGHGASNPVEMEAAYRQAGLGLGHCYSLLQVKVFPERNLKLMQIRNPWGSATEWTGAWSDQSDLWGRYPDVAGKCNRAADDGTFWMEWSDVKRYFDGGGVCFTKPTWFDYRVRGTFQSGRPSVVLEITVTEPTGAYLVLSQRDKRGQPADSPYAAQVAMMLSIAAQDANPKKMRVKCNSTTDADNPSEKFTFAFARDLGIMYHFEPSPMPYLVIPRIYESTIPTRDFTLGLITERPIGDGIEVAFKSLPADCKVIRNFTTFDYDADAVPTTSAQFQCNPDSGVFFTRDGERLTHIEAPALSEAEKSMLFQ